MRNSFFGYYRPTDDEYDLLWKEALIVFDTNALLNFYRVPPAGREALFKTLEYFSERLWIPYQVGLEFHRNRFEVVRQQKKLTTDALAKTGALIKDLKDALTEIKIDQHDIDFEPTRALEKLEAPLDEISAAIRKVQDTEINLISSDPVRDRLDAIFTNKIGPAPATQAELDILCRDVDKRFESKIPPGWKDAKSKKDESFIGDHLFYQNAHGDLIFWRQLLEHLKTTGIKKVLLVTNENKEDWWWKESGEIVGPLPELMREIRREAEVELFWMYKTDLFLKTSQKYTAETFEVTPEAVAEVQEVVERDDHESSIRQKIDRLRANWAYNFDPEVLRNVANDRIDTDWFEVGRDFSRVDKSPDYIQRRLFEPEDNGYSDHEHIADLTPVIGSWLEHNRGNHVATTRRGEFLVDTPHGKRLTYKLAVIDRREQVDKLAHGAIDVLLQAGALASASRNYSIIFAFTPEVYESVPRSLITNQLHLLGSRINVGEIIVAVTDGQWFNVVQTIGKS